MFYHYDYVGGYVIISDFESCCISTAAAAVPFKAKIIANAPMFPLATTALSKRERERERGGGGEGEKIKIML